MKHIRNIAKKVLSSAQCLFSIILKNFWAEVFSGSRNTRIFSPKKITRQRHQIPAFTNHPLFTLFSNNTSSLGSICKTRIDRNIKRLYHTSRLSDIAK